RVAVLPMHAIGAVLPATSTVLGQATPMLPWTWALGAAWLAGVLLAMAGLLRQQRRFVRGLGALRCRDDGIWQAQGMAGLPAVVGLWRPRIVLPVDFEQRYTAPERRLVLMHERVHLHRGDIVVNALLAAMQCLYWFNPLVPLALRRCREDQEFSCDERVIARSDGARRSYGNAMLKTGLSLSPLPVGCHWRDPHPLKERIAMLKHPVPGKKQWLAMVLLTVGLSSGLGYAAWAAQPAQVRAVAAGAAYYSVKLRLEVDGQARDFEVREHAGKPFAFSMETPAGHTWTGEFKVEPLDAAHVALSGTLREGRLIITAPRLVVEIDGTARMHARTKDGDSLFKMEAVVAELGMQAGAMAAVQDPAARARVGVELADAPARTPGFADMPPPRYPPSMNTGEVVLKVDVAADGTATGVVVDRSSGHADLDEAAMDAARQWKFVPAYKDGKAVAGQVRVPVRFAMDETTTTTEESTS
ncbi:MAG: TonB family protein, partial [Stenotrophomonas nitritireducens]|nr:TonB family protein [Stenotrophomonas nitritireducens]